MRSALRRRRGAGVLIGFVVSGLVHGVAQPASAAVPPVVSRTAAVVSADGLPTTQVNGVVYAQVVAGNTVYAGGKFTSARPAGAAAGTEEVARSHLLAFDITTGVLKSFAPKLNGQVKAVALSADKKTLFVVGAFTKVGTTTRNRFAAFDVATGALKKMAPSFNYTVATLAVTATKVYVGGGFTSVNGSTRTRLAAVSATTGSLDAWKPTANVAPQAMTPTPNQTMIIVGGAFTKLNTTTAYGMGALDAKTGATKTWKINSVVKNSGSGSAILSLAADADTVYGSGYAYGGGNFEGAFAASPTDGSVRWLQDCHGDTYDVQPIGSVVYSVGHAHYCKNIGGFPDTDPRKAWYRALAVTKNATGRVATNGQAGAHYGSFAGQPAPSLINWFPELEPGTYTGLSQSAWSVTGNTTYLVLGGEFTKVNGVRQQGLVRLAIPSKTTQRQGPMLSGADLAPTASEVTTASATLRWTADWDRDDTDLSYQVLRDGVVVKTMAARSQFWVRPTLTFSDTGLSPGTSYVYQIRALDPAGNVALGAKTEVATPAAPPTPTDAAPTPAPTPTATPTAAAG